MTVSFGKFYDVFTLFVGLTYGAVWRFCFLGISDILSVSNKIVNMIGEYQEISEIDLFCFV